MKIKNVLAIGAGTMGSQVGFYYAMQGFNVTQYDVSAEALEHCRELHRKYAADYRSVRTGVSAADVEAGLANITYCSKLAEAAQNADLVTESAPEVLDIKQQLYTQLGLLCPQHTIFTTNTSTMMPSAMAEFSGRPERFLALHYALGIWHAPIAEIMKHPGTDDAVFQEVVAFTEAARLAPIKLETEQPGYITNSLLVPWLMAGLSLVVNGVCSYQDVDRTWMTCAQGMRSGPIGALDSVGFEVARNVMRLLAAAEPNNPQHLRNIAYLEKNFIDKGHTGALCGQGFYSYPNPEYLQPDFIR
jgi:3-hydroxybutyryl-CoA dehydrogenase